MHVTWSQRLSIRGRLLLLLLTMTVAFGAYLAVSIGRQADEERRSAQARMVESARLAAARLDDRIGDIRQLLAVLALMADPTHGALAANDALIQRLAPSIPAEIAGLGVWTVDGENVGSGHATVPARFTYSARRRLFDAARDTRAMTIEAPVFLPDTGERAALFAMPIVREGRFLGIATASIRVQTLEAVLQTEDTVAGRAVVTVFDGDGVILARSVDGDRWVGQRSIALSATPASAGLSTRRGPDGVDRIGGLAATARAPWSVYVGIPIGLVMQPVHTRVVEHLQVGAAILLTGLLAASWIARRISAPLHRLADDAARFESGAWSHRSPVRDGGEIGQLATMMNRMAQTLEERDAMLRASESRLRAITDGLPVLISLLDTGRCFRFANKAYSDWLGLAPEGMIGRTLAEVYGAATYEGFAHHIEAGLSGRRVVYERDLETLEGTKRVEVTLIPKGGEHGRSVEGLYVLMQDVTANREAVARRIRGEQRLSLALEGSDAAFFDWALETGQVHLGARGAALLGRPAVQGSTSAEQIFAGMHPDDVAAARDALDATLHGRTDRLDVDYRMAGDDGRWVWIRTRGRIVERDANGRALRLAGTSTDVTSTKAAEERLRHLATYDLLTGLPNRGLFLDRLTQALARTHRSPGRLTAVLYLDIDHFKTVNDTFGHAAGDRLLVDFARAMQQTLRSVDTVARLSGDEFAVILEGLHDRGEARRIAQKLVDRARLTVASGDRSIQVSTSLGIAVVHPDDHDVVQVLARADAALYDAKRGGRDRHSGHDELELPDEALATAH